MMRLERHAAALVVLGIVALVLALVLTVPIAGTFIESRQEIGSLRDKLDQLQQKIPDRAMLERRLDALLGDSALIAFRPLEQEGAEPATLLSERPKAEGIPLVLKPILSETDEPANVVRRQFAIRISPDDVNRLALLIEDASPPWFFESFSAKRAEDGSAIDVAGVVRTYRSQGPSPTVSSPTVSSP